jgi:hypothetical protein
MRSKVEEWGGHIRWIIQHNFPLRPKNIKELIEILDILTETIRHLDFSRAGMTDRRSEALNIFNEDELERATELSEYLKCKGLYIVEEDEMPEAPKPRQEPIRRKKWWEVLFGPCKR